MSPRWLLRSLAAVVVVLLALAVAGRGPRSGDAAVGAAAPSTTVVTATTIVDNDFIPDDANLSDCISGVPRPGCGSDAKGGWRQGLVFAAVAVGMAFIGWRLVRAVRARPDAA